MQASDSPVEIVALRQQPEFIHELAQWHQQEWRYSGRSVPITRRVQRLRSHLESNGLPNTWLALSTNSETHRSSNASLLGSVSLVDYVFQNSCDTSAWVANLFVVPEQRGKGLGAELLAFAEGQAEGLNLSRLFLFTPDHRDFYQSKRWAFVNQARVQGQWVDVMTKDLNSDRPVDIQQGQEDSLIGGQNIRLQQVLSSAPSQSRW